MFLIYFSLGWALLLLHNFQYSSTVQYFTVTHSAVQNSTLQFCAVQLASTGGVTSTAADLCHQVQTAVSLCYQACVISLLSACVIKCSCQLVSHSKAAATWPPCALMLGMLIRAPPTSCRGRGCKQREERA
jgi:hypothetical protein